MDPKGPNPLTIDLSGQSGPEGSESLDNRLAQGPDSQDSLERELFQDHMDSTRAVVSFERLLKIFENFITPVRLER